MAEREGFEPSIRLLTLYSLSRGAPSTTRPSLRSLLCQSLLYQLPVLFCRQVVESAPGAGFRDGCAVRPLGRLSGHAQDITEALLRFCCTFVDPPRVIRVQGSRFKVEGSRFDSELGTWNFELETPNNRRFTPVDRGQTPCAARAPRAPCTSR